MAWDALINTCNNFILNNDNSSSTVQKVLSKTVVEGVGYTQLNKLSLALISKDTEIQFLKDSNRKLQENNSNIILSKDVEGSCVKNSEIESLKESLLSKDESIKLLTERMNLLSKENESLKLKILELEISNKNFRNNNNHTKVDVSKETISAPVPSTVPSLPTVNVNIAKYEKYTKMKSMHLPEGAIRQKMTTDRLSNSEIEEFFNPGGSSSKAPPVPIKPKIVLAPKKAVQQAPPEGMNAKMAVQPSSKMRALFWTKLSSADVVGTIWHMTPDFDLTSSDQLELESLFSTSVVATPTKSQVQKDDEKSKAIVLFDGKRTQNVQIAMGKLRKSAEICLEMVTNLDPNELTLESTQVMLMICPTKDELVAIHDYHSSNYETLDKTGQLFYFFNKIPRVQRRLECHEIAFSWENNARVCATKINHILAACEELKVSEKMLTKLFSIILSTGNYINGGTPRGQAYGIKLDILIKLGNTKTNNHLTLLHFLASHVEQKSPELLNIWNIWSSILASAEISFKQLQIDLKLLQTQMKGMKNELQIGIPSILEHSIANPLIKRINDFVNFSDPYFLTMENNLINAELETKKLMVKFGSDLNSDDGDPYKSFFNLLVTFTREFDQAVNQNTLRRIKEEKSNKKSNSNDSSDNKQESKDIFAKFHASQKPSAPASNSIMLELQAKLTKKR
jgi:hypothetical protein